GAPRARARCVVRGRADRRAGPRTPACNACGHRTRYIPCAAPPSRPAAAECCPTHTVTSPCAEAQRFHPIKGRRFKSDPRNHRKAPAVKVLQLVRGQPADRLPGVTSFLEEPPRLGLVPLVVERGAGSRMLEQQLWRPEPRVKAVEEPVADRGEHDG